MKRLKVVYMGTPDFAVGPLRALYETATDACEVVGVVTAPDRPAGRGQQLRPSAVKEYALTVGLPILQPERLKNPEWIEQLRALEADLFVVVAFRMLPEVVFAMPRLGTFNLHGSLLPQYRGAAPINWALINGETQTGVTTFFIDQQIDCGAIIDQRTVEITPEDNVGTLHDKLCAVGSTLVAETVQAIAEADARGERIATRPQPEGELKPAPKIFKEDGRIDWTQSGAKVALKIRGLSPYPAAWAQFANGLNAKILQARFEAEISTAQCGTLDSDGKHYLRVAVPDGWIYIETLHPEGKRPMAIADFLRGVRLPTR